MQSFSVSSTRPQWEVCGKNLWQFTRSALPRQASRGWCKILQSSRTLIFASEWYLESVLRLYRCIREVDRNLWSIIFLPREIVRSSSLPRSGMQLKSRLNDRWRSELCNSRTLISLSIELSLLFNSPSQLRGIQVVRKVTAAATSSAIVFLRLSRSAVKRGKVLRFVHSELIANNFTSLPASSRSCEKCQRHTTAFVAKCAKLAPARQRFSDTGNVPHFCHVPQREFTLRAAHNVELLAVERCPVSVKLFYNSEIAVSHLFQRSDASRRNNVAASRMPE